MATLGMPPAAQGLYLPEFEQDACGVGFIANLKGEKSHQVIRLALQMLKNLSHRGATGFDPRTGDGAGILMQVPHKFLRAACKEAKIDLPTERDYGVGLVFLPRLPAERQEVMARFEQTIKDEGQRFLGWRTVPVNNAVLGEIGRNSEPTILQLFIGRGKGVKDEGHFERKLFVIRKVMENFVRASKLSEKSFFYVPSLSCRTLVYKGLMLAEEVENFFSDLAAPETVSALALVHQRYSTNTFPTWDLAHPFRYLCHNGEINTLRGNINWMRAREALFSSPLFGEDLAKLLPIATPGGSDSAVLDNALELLYHSGRSLPEAIMMLIPEAWQNHETMSDEKKAFYEYHACMMEPWDGPASIPFTDGKCIGAVLDRNGLRPSRYTVTKDNFVIMASETGVLEIDPAEVVMKGRLQPGRMFLVDMEKGRIVDDAEIKHEVASRLPYRQWLNSELVPLKRLTEAAPKAKSKAHGLSAEAVVELQQIFGYTLEDLKIILGPMATNGEEPVGSMGTDTPLAVLSERPQLLYNYFKQLFAQVTNPPLDAIREELVTSMNTYLGSEQNLFTDTPEHCRLLKLDHAVLTNDDLERLRQLNQPGLKAATLPMLFRVADGGDGLKAGMDALCAAAAKAINAGATLLILSDRGASADMAPIPALLATAGVHHYLIREKLRMRCGLVVETGEAREVHHFCLLLGFGAGAINPWLVYESLEDMIRQDLLSDIDQKTANKNFIKAINKGVLKVMSKMGISTLQSYRGAQIFEAVGLSSAVVDQYFTHCASRLEGMGLAELAEDCRRRHVRAFPQRQVPETLKLEVGGEYQWRRNGELHILNPLAIAKLQQAVRTNNQKCYEDFSRLVAEDQERIYTLRSLFDFDFAREPIPLEEVEPWTAIVKRFKTGAMSYGSLAKEAHETLAIAMNKLGGKSNSGEGGEDADRYKPDANGNWRRSAIKQVASGRFGVTSHYLANAIELQIKMAQGAKPGEGGQLPGFKVYPWIAKTRHATPYVTLISPPPHHDIYSIEDLAQLIHDLKNSNQDARISVKLVSEVGVGTVAAGVSKGKADVVLISGYDGGTGASPVSSIKHGGLPWELGLSETQQTLVLNGLRHRIVVECDGKLLTGRDVAIAALVGAEEFGFSAGPLVSVGCIMMRVCHLNTCPVGIATQDPELRQKFNGKPEHVISYFRFVAEDLRRLMAKLGFRTIAEMVGQVDRLKVRANLKHWKASKLKLDRILHKPVADPRFGIRNTEKQDHGLANALDKQLIAKALPALQHGHKVAFDQPIANINRTVGTILSHAISRKYGEEGLPEDTIVINCRGSAGQSFSAFGAHGVTFRIEGDANDYFGKGLSGAKLIIYPPRTASFVAEDNILIGNVALYGATSGQAYIRGQAGERFGVRNSGVHAVVEGVGDHGCEYMTGGRVVVLGHTGRNFAAGMSGGVAYVLDEAGDFAKFRCNREMVDLDEITEDSDKDELKALIERHQQVTGSAVAQRILDTWQESLTKFIKVMPKDYKRALAMAAREAEEAKRAGKTRPTALSHAH